MEEFERTCCIRGYHVYREIWEAAVGEELMCAREPHNSHDRYVVKREGVVDGRRSDKGPLGSGRPFWGFK